MSLRTTDSFTKEILESFVEKNLHVFPYRASDSKVCWDYKRYDLRWYRYYSDLVNLYEFLSNLEDIIHCVDAYDTNIKGLIRKVTKHTEKYVRRLHKLNLIEDMHYEHFINLIQPVKHLKAAFGSNNLIRQEDGTWKLI